MPKCFNGFLIRRLTSYFEAWEAEMTNLEDSQVLTKAFYSLFTSLYPASHLDAVCLYDF